MRDKAVFFLLAGLILQGCSDDEKVADRMNPTADGSYLLILQSGEVTFRSIVGGQVAVNLEADWRGQVESGMRGRQDFLLAAQCGDLILSEMENRFFIDALPNSPGRKTYDGCGLGEISPFSWEVIAEPAT